jgi:YfiH family protein
MTAHLGLPADRLISVHQVHSPDVVRVEGAWAAERPRADAMVTATPGLALGVLTADCGPILFADPHARVIGAAHAGWKGAFTGVIDAVAAGMEDLGARRERIIAVLGPTISRTAYEVGPEFVARFLGADAGCKRFFAPSGRVGHAMFDLPSFIAVKAVEAGIGHFEDLSLCTYADPARFFSYRRTTHAGEPDYGRQVSAIALVP